MSLAEIIDELPRLSAEERALLAERLAETADPVHGGSVAEAWMQEASRRDEEWTSGRVQGIPGDEALARVRSRFPA